MDEVAGQWEVLFDMLLERRRPRTRPISYISNCKEVRAAEVASAADVWLTVGGGSTTAVVRHDGALSRRVVDLRTAQPAIDALQGGP